MRTGRAQPPRVLSWAPPAESLVQFKLNPPIFALARAPSSYGGTQRRNPGYNSGVKRPVLKLGLGGRVGFWGF